MYTPTRNLKKDDAPKLPAKWNDIRQGIDYRPATRRQAQPWHAHLPEIVDATTDFVAIMDDKGLLHYLNRAGRSMLGFSDGEDITGIDMAAYCPEQTSRRLLTEAFPTAQRYGVWHGKSVVRAAGGREIQLSQTILAHGGPGGQAMMFSTIARDIGERKQFEQAPKRHDTHDFLTAMETDLQHALNRGEFILHYQPQFNFCTGGLAGFEALLRWQHPVRGLVMPSDFLPLLEESGQIEAVGEWVLRRACEESRQLRDIGGAPVPMSVNISARQFNHRHLVDKLRRILRDENMPPGDLELEITEGTLMRDPQMAGETLAALDGLGVRLAIDDFGTGYSSLAHLKRFPVSTLKIDRMFIRDLPWEGNCSILTEASISLGHKLGLAVVAEGVETAKQFQFLRTHGCDMIQGHYFGIPMPLDEAARFAMRYQPIDMPSAA